MNYSITNYPDKASYLTWDILVDADGNKVDKGFLNRSQFIFRINTYEDLWHLNQLVDVCNSQGVTPSITIPNLIDAQADRRFSDNTSFGLKLVLQSLIRMDATFKIFHPHNPEVVEMAFEIMNKGRNLQIIDNEEFIRNVFSEILTYEQYDHDSEALESNLILMSSDAGGFKPMMKLCDKLEWGGETFSASKSRKWTSEGSYLEQIIDRQDFGGKDILLIDDISVYGGTFKGLSKLLKSRNCGKLYLAVSHMTIQNLGKDPVSNYFDKVFTTNSKFETCSFIEEIKAFGGNYTEKRNQPENLEIIKLF